MPRTRIAARLEIVEEQIGLAEASIEVQLGVLKQLRSAKHATEDAQTHLTILAAKLVTLLAERDKLRAERDAHPPA